MSAIPSVRVRTSGWQADVSETFLTHCEAQALANTDPKFMVTVLEAIGGTKGEKGDAGEQGNDGVGIDNFSADPMAIYLISRG